jgi:tetratricopeptide (TPR) repeat protein
VDGEDNISLEKLLDELRKKYPDIRPNNEEDWDWTWADDGFEFLDAGDYAHAEYMFEQLIVSQPQFFEGYEGLALVQQAEGNKQEALLLIDRAVTLARNYLKIGGIDQNAMDEIVDEQRQIREM